MMNTIEYRVDCQVRNRISLGNSSCQLCVLNNIDSILLFPICIAFNFSVIAVVTASAF